MIGTVIPQNRSPEEYLRAFGGYTYRLFEVLDIFDMYHSWWFQFLVLMLTANILVCSIDRLSANWKIIFPGKPVFRKSRFQRQAGRNEFSDDRQPERLRSHCESAVSRGFSTVTVEASETGFTVFAEKGRLSRLGVYIVHLSVMVLLLGALIGSMFGFDGYVNIPEGETVQQIRMRNTGDPLTLAFGIRCNDFDVSFYKTGQPKEYRSSLSIIENGETVYQKDIVVNDPLRYRGINMFQSSYGEMPRDNPAPEVQAPKEITLTFTSVESGMVYSKTSAIGQTVKLPEEMGTFAVDTFDPSASFMGQRIGAALKGTLTPLEGDPVEVLLPLRFPNFDKMRRGALVISIAGYEAEKFAPGTETGVEPRYYTGLQVTHDPGVWVVYSGFILMIIGCFITFFISHQQICIDVAKHEKGSRLMVSGVANRNRIAIQKKVAKLSNALRESI